MYLDKVSIFNIGALGYDLITRQYMWYNQIARVLDYLDTPKDHLHILDLGCGPGVSTFVLGERIGEKASITGIDIAERMIERARVHHRKRFAHLPKIDFQVADATALPFDNGAFDAAVGHSFLYLVNDRLRVLQEIQRVLSPGGKLVLMEPDAQGSLMRAAWKAKRHLYQLFRHPYSAVCFSTSMFLWRSFSSMAGQMTREMVKELFQNAEFAKVECHPTLAGLGIHCVGTCGK